MTEVQQVKIQNKKLWYNFSLSRPINRNWTKKESHALIDMWAFICWGVGSSTHKSMSNQVGLIPQLWNKQHGRCAVSGLDLGGGPADGQRAIGIDIIRPKIGPRKGNVRLVCGPLAMTRWIDFNRRTITVGKPDPMNYERYDIAFAIVKHIEWAMRADFFRNLPILVAFPQVVMVDDPIFDLAEFSWFTMAPSQPEPEENKTGWEYNSTNKHHFMRVILRDDVLILYTFKKPKYSTRITRSSLYYGPDEDKRIKIPLSDPNIDMIDTIVRQAKQSLILSMQYWYDPITP